MVAHDRDSNAILAESLKNRSESELTRAYKQIVDYFKVRGLKPQFQTMDNECPQGLQTYMDLEK